MRAITPDDVSLSDTLPSVDLFLAGGITNCSDWQAEAIRLLGDQDIVVDNPRRNRLLASAGAEAACQIRWEYEFLKRARVVLFWFPKESLCSIALFELGKEIGRNSCVFVGAHPDYARRFDIVTRVDCYKSGMTVYSELTDVVMAAQLALNY